MSSSYTVTVTTSQLINPSTSSVMSPTGPPSRHQPSSSSKRPSTTTTFRGRQVSASVEGSGGGGGTSSKGAFKDFFRIGSSSKTTTPTAKGKERETDESTGVGSPAFVRPGPTTKSRVKDASINSPASRSAAHLVASQSTPPAATRQRPPDSDTIRKRTVSAYPGALQHPPSSPPTRPARPLGPDLHTPYLTPSGSLSSPAIHLSSNPLSEAYAERGFLPANSIDALVSPHRNRSTSKPRESDPSATIRQPHSPPTFASSSETNVSQPPPPKRQSSLQNHSPTTSMSLLTSAVNPASSRRRRQQSAPAPSGSVPPPVSYGHSRPPSSSSSSTSTSTTSVSHPTHKRAISYPISEGRQAIRQATSFVLREMARPLPSAVRTMASMGWEEVDIRLRALSRTERTWAGMGMGTMGSQGAQGEERERKAFESTFRDGVVLCFLLNRLFSVTLQPPLRPSLKESETAFERNVNLFISTLDILGLPPRCHFYPTDLVPEPASMDGLQRVANTILEISRLPIDLPSASTFASSTARRRNSASSVGSNASSVTGGTILPPSSYSPPVQRSPPISPQRNVFTPPPDSPSTGRAESPSIPPGIGLTTAQEGEISDVRAARTRRRVSDDGAYRRRITPPSPLRQGSQGSEQQETFLRRGPSPSPSVSPSPSPALTPRKRPSPKPIASSANLQDRRSNRTDVAEAGSNPRFSLLSEALETEIGQHNRERTPSLISANDKRESTDSRSSGVPSTEDGLHLTGLMPVVEIVSASPSPTPTEEIAQPKSTQFDLGHGYDSDSSVTRTMSPPNLGPRALPSILRPSSPSGPQQRPLGVRRVSPSMLSRSGASSSSGLQSITAGEATESNISQYPRRHVPKRGASVDLSRKSSSAVSLPGLAEDAAAHDGLPSNSRTGSPLLGPIALGPSRPTSPAGSNGKRIVPSVGIHRRNTTQARAKGDMSPPPLRVPFPPVNFSTSGGHGSQSVPASPFSSDSRPGSPSFADNSQPDYSRPPASRTTKFADEVDGSSDRDSRSRESSAGGRPQMMKKRGESMSEEGRFGKGGANGPGKGGVFGSPGGSPKGLSRDASTTSFSKGSETRQLITFREEGKPSVVYRLGNCIGKGQFGTVYRALNLGNGSMHAIKRIRLEGLQEDDITQLMKEVELLKRLSHPSIVKYEGMMRDDDTLNIILEYIENGSLGSTLKSFGDLTEHLVSSYVMKILEGLHYLHGQQVVHCDLKAANILTTKSGNVKLSDFGVSLNLVAVEHKKENDVAGTPNWMAPEVIQMEGASTASDIWSLGCTVVELLTGRPPFSEIHNGMAVMYRIVEGGPPPFPEGASPELQSFLSQCFEKDPTMRPSADVLFEHDWVKPHLAMNKLRPQESIPFLRRVSADLENLKDIKDKAARASMSSAGTSERAFERSYSVPTPVTSPLVTPETSSPNKFPSKPSDATLVGRKSQDTARRPASPRAATSPLPIPAAEEEFYDEAPVFREHRFVKSTFSKAVICKVCAEPVKKSAVFCEGCTLLCHVACAKVAPLNCDLRAQIRATTAQRDHLHRQLTQGSSNDPTSSSSLPNSSPISSSGTHKLFGGAFKRSKSPPPPPSRPSNDFTIRRKSEDQRPMSPNGPNSSRWAFPSIAGRQSEDACGSRPRSRQSRVSAAGSSVHSSSNDDGSLGSRSSAAGTRGTKVSMVSEFAVSTPPYDRSRRSSGVTTGGADDGSRGGGIHKSQGSRDCVVM